MPRPLDPNVGDAIAGATLRLLAQRGFAATTMDAVAAEAGVGKPAIYRRFRDKAALVADVISRQLPVLEAQDLDGEDVRLELDELPARVAQHELDHLDGVLILDRTTDDARREAMATLRAQLSLA